MAEPPALDNLFDRVRLAREGAAVERCHAHPHLMRYSVGHHSLDMVTMITLAWLYEHGVYPRAELLIAAAFHDVPERVVGDVPQPVKHLLGTRVLEAEGLLLRWLGVDVFLTTEEQRWLHEADRLELWLWCREEQQRGNQYFAAWEVEYTKRWEREPLPLGLRHVYERAMELPKGERLDTKTLMEVCGL